MLLQRVVIIAILVSTSGCELFDPEEDGAQYSLTAVARSGTTLQLQWESMGSGTRYTVDYFSQYTTCEFPPTHGNVHEVTGTSVTLTGLTPSTQYHIHVHDLPNYAESTHIIMVRTLAAGSVTQPVTTADYTICD